MKPIRRQESENRQGKRNEQKKCKAREGKKVKEMRQEKVRLGSKRQQTTKGINEHKKNRKEK